VIGKFVWLLTIGFSSIVLIAGAVIAQETEARGRFETSILDDEPFDLITLTPEWRSEEVRVFPIEFPKGGMPTQPDPESEFEVKLVIFPDRLYRVAWKDIAKIERYESLVLGEAKRLLGARQFAPAFEHLNFLIENFPKTPNLDAMRQEFLLTSAFEAYRSGSLAQAFAVLEEFVRKYPDSRLINQAKGKISEWAGQMIEQYFNNGDLETARLMVGRLARDYRDPPMPVVDVWRKKFIAYAETYRDKALKLREEGNFPDARTSATQMLKIAPDIPEGQSLLRDLILAYPMVRVGVFQQASRMDVTELADWPVRRSGSLVSQPLFEFRNSGPEGGSYRMTLGSFVHTDDRTELELRLKNLQPGQPTAYEISQWMMRRANIEDANYHAPWAAILKQVKVDSSDSLLVQLKRPHVLPHAFLQWPLEALQSDLIQSATLYGRSEDRGGNRHSFRWKSPQKAAEGQPVEIVESLYTDPKEAVADLVKGEIEVIDRLFPADAAQLQNVREIRVESYALPIVHMLVPKSQHPFVKDRDFRRALLYAVNRQAILNGEILGGVSRNDSQLISGPFPIGVDENDPLAYAYNKDIQPIAYDPKLAQLLVILTKQKLTAIATKAKEPVPELTPIRLGVPDYESARVAGEAFIQQWKIAGIPGELVVLPSNPKEQNANIDLLYLSASLWEPATDAERLFGEGGLAESDNIFIVQVLSNLRTANNWREVRQFCQDLHALVSTHLPVLPLWQVGESFAYRNILKGIPKKPVALYQDIDRWRMSVPDFDR
jgi:hypothetical protein